MARLLDRLIAWLMRPRIRRIRRWSFLATGPIAVAVAYVYDVQHGVWIVAARLALVVAVALVAWRLGGARGEALRDLLMHPRGRAFLRAETDVLSALPRLLLGRRRAQGMDYWRGGFGVALALAFTPLVVAEAAALHLLIGGGTIAWILTACHAYMLLWLWGFALGPRAYPHRVGTRTAVLRKGPMYRVAVPIDAIERATARTERAADVGLVERDGAVMLAARGRVDVWLELSQPVAVQRPLGEPLSTRRLAIASDEPDRLVAALLAPAPVRSTVAHRGFALPAALDLAGLARDGAQPG